MEPSSNYPAHVSFVNIGSNKINRKLTQQTSSVELFLQSGVQLGGLLSLNVLLHDALAALLGQNVFFAGLDLTLLTQGQQVVAFVPLAEGASIDHDDGVLYQGLGTDQLVVRSVVHYIDDTSLAGGSFRSPGKVSGIQTEGTELSVSTASAHEVDTGSSNLKQGEKPLVPQ